MTRYIPGIIVALGWLSGCNFSQSPLTCVIGQGGGAGGWFAKYTLRPSQPAGPCSTNLGEGLGVRKYFPDGQKPLVVIRTDTLGNLSMSMPPDPDPSHSPNSSGNLTQDAPDSNHLCTIPVLTRAEQNVGGSDIAYEWSDVKFVVQANIPGTQMSATLRYTEGGCTAQYGVVGMQPNADCFQVDAQGNPVLDTGGNQIPDDSRCGPGSFPQTNVNPDFAVRCDPVLFKCVLTSDPPALKPGVQ